MPTHDDPSSFLFSLKRVSLVASLALAVGCSQEVDTEPKVAKLSEALNASAPGNGSGLLWRLPSGELSVWDAASATDFKPFTLGYVDSAWQTVGTGDFNGDGAGDLLWRNSRDKLLSIWHLNDTRVLSMTPATAGAPTGDPPLIGDLDGDGVSDLIWKTQTSVSLPTPPWGLTIYVQTTWMMDSGSTTPRSVTTTSSQGDIAQFLGNFDGDSLKRADILYRAPNGAVSVQISGGSRISLSNPANDWVIVGVGDFNADQTSDILWYNKFSGEVSTWILRNGALESWAAPGSSHPSGGWKIQGVADVDHDGISDIVWRHDTGQISIWTMSGPGTVREFGAGYYVDPSFAFAGVVELGPPMHPGTPKLDGVKLEQGKTIAHFTLSQDSQRRHDQIEIQEVIGKSTVSRGRFGYWPTAQANTMEAAIDTAIFQGKDRACFRIRNWEQGRVSGFSKPVCLRGLPAPTIAFEWGMPEMFGGDADFDGAIDLTPSPSAISSLRSNRWWVWFYACGSNDTLAGGTITTYSWSIGTPGGPPAPSADGTSCWIGSWLAEGTYFVGLTVRTADGRVASISQEAKVQNHLIVSMGDSYASGEGNPVRAANWNRPLNFTGPTPSVGVPYERAFWGTLSDLSCHRTANAGAARAALALERSDPHSSVTYLSVACSGAEARHLMTDYYEGIVEVDDLVHPPQIQQIKTILGVQPQPKIDALVVSIGGNDIGFGDIIASCTLGTDYFFWDECSEDEELHAEIATKMNSLAGTQIVNLGGAFTTPGTLDRLADAVFTLDYRGVYHTEYPDPLRNANGVVCDEVIFEDAIPGDGEIGHEDLVWASSFVVGNLNAAINFGISQHDTIGRWRTVPGIANGFFFNGYCVDPHMVVRYDESQQTQADKFGSMHPNFLGQTVYAERIIEALARDGVGSTAALAFVPREQFVLPW